MRKGRSGLVSYGGDSEISDSEDEHVSLSMSPSNSIPTNSLGIPGSVPLHLSSPPSLPRPVVEAAPTTSLVDYGEEDHNDSKGDNVVTIDNVTSVLIMENDSYTEESSPRKDELPTIEVTPYELCDVPVYLDTRDIILPQEPMAKCSKALQAKIINLLQKRASSGLDLNESLKQRKDLRNPSIYEKLVQFCNLDEFGTNYPEHLYDPKEWTEESFYDNLFKDQRKEYMKKEKSKLDRTTIEFVTGTKRPPVSVAKTDVAKKPRRSKWDIGSSSGPESGGSRGTSPTSLNRDRPPLLGSAPAGMQPRVLQTAVGAQARVQAKELHQK